MPTYATLTSTVELTCRSTVRFQSCAYILLKSGAMAAGPRLTPVIAADGSSTVIVLVAEDTEIGMANGGFALRPVTVLIVGACVRIAYAARTDVLPFLKGSHAKPTRGSQFMLLV